MVSNVVEGLGEGGAVYVAILAPQGKYLFDFLLVADGADVLIDTAADRAEALAKRLKMYCLRRDASLAPEPGLSVVLLWGEGTAPAGAVADPREPALGWRMLTSEPEAALAGAEPATRADYDALRVAHGVPESGVELVPEDTFILEAGFERLHGVDFRKGCYVGQEVTARMKHKTELKKRLVRVSVEGGAAPGTPVETEEGKPAGTLFTQASGAGLAHLRLDRARAGGLRAGDARVSLAEE